MATLSTHVLDTATGRPAAGVAVALQDGSGATIAEAVTDADGRVRPLGGDLGPGDYRLTFATGDYFAAAGRAAFHPRISVEFSVTGTAAGHVGDDGDGDSGDDHSGDDHYHVPLLLSPYGYTTYRGS